MQGARSYLLYDSHCQKDGPGALRKKEHERVRSRVIDGYYGCVYRVRAPILQHTRDPFRPSMGHKDLDRFPDEGPSHRAAGTLWQG